MRLTWHHNEMINDIFQSFRGFQVLVEDEIRLHELSLTHFVALRILRHRKVVSMSQLTDQLEVTHGAGTGVVDRLCKLGLVARHHSPSDRRVVEVALTPQGTALVEAIAKAVEAKVEGIIGLLGAENRDQLAKGLQLLAGAFRSSQVQPDGEPSHAANR